MKARKNKFEPKKIDYRKIVGDYINKHFPKGCFSEEEIDGLELLLKGIYNQGKNDAYIECFYDDLDSFYR